MNLTIMFEPFDFSKDYVLADDCVMLRPFMQTDADLLMHFALHEPELWKFSLITAASKQKMEEYVQLAIESRVQKNSYPFIVFDKRTNRYAGSTRFYDIQIKHKTLQLGYTWYGQEFQGSGLNAHCKFLMLHFAFETLGFERVEFRADVNNARSIAAMKSIGCTVEGVLKSNLLRDDGTRRDSIVLRILRDEWFSSVKETLMLKIQPTN